MIEKTAKKSRQLFESGYCCAESVLMAISESKNIRSDLIPKIATGFCGGMAHTCGPCGAVSGGIMGINLISGRDSSDESNEENCAMIQKLIDNFKNKFGSINCFDLTECDLGTPEGQKTFTDENIIERCLDYTEEATRMALTILQENNSEIWE
jgi:C_GCAxxG_C_C family probable redox protein